MPTLLERFRAIGDAGPLDVMPIVTGSYADYRALKPHHYRPGNPMTLSRVLVIRDDTPSAGDRFTNRQATPQPIAVLVESLPSLSCRLRDEALGGRYGHLRPKPRSALLNQELRCISRVIVDPRYRGLGLAVGLVKHALATATTRYTEALAVMGRVTPFFKRSGMTEYERQPLPAEERVLAAFQFAGIDPHQLALPRQVEQRIARLPESTRAFLTQELRRWHRTGGGRNISRSPTLADVLSAAQQKLLARPIYYLHENTHVQHPPVEAGIDPD